jgi:glutamate formiminotransferase / 5-formyltetrahydrofolate cyclo-ligase
MPEIVQCVPNFSEGRRHDVVDALVEEIKSVPGVSLLDYSLDCDHNRCVITYVGDLQAVVEGAFRAVKKAVERIDMRGHTGGHPRMGAADVIPLIPVSGIGMDECAAGARQLGQRLGEELNIPVFLYEAAASSPERRNLAALRAGEFEGLQEAMDRGRTPDFGPPRLHPTAGATAVGARRPLVAYNVNLTTSDVGVARKIAAAVRERSGGLANVKALGIYLEEEKKAQVTMNLVNCEATPIHRVVEAIKVEAARYGVGVAETEVVGLIPVQYLLDAAVHYLQLNRFSLDQILESRIR